ncbi:hypothetical protein [Streptomyces sp. WG-D5]
MAGYAVEPSVLCSAAQHIRDAVNVEDVLPGFQDFVRTVGPAEGKA